MVDFMKKTELMKEFQELEEEKQVHIDGIASVSYTHLTLPTTPYV